MTGQCRHPFFTYFKMFPHIYIRLTLHVVMHICRNHNSSQDSTASSLTAEKMLHRQDRNPTPERLQAKANPSTNRRKRLVRQFSLWVHISFDQPSVVTNTPHNTWSFSKAMRSKLHLVQSLFIYLLASNHEDEDNLPEALAAIASQSTGKSGSTSSLDKQIQPSIYPQVAHTPTQTHLKTSQTTLPYCTHTFLYWINEASFGIINK